MTPKKKKKQWNTIIAGVPLVSDSSAGQRRGPTPSEMASMPRSPPQPDVRTLQQSMAAPSVSQAQAIVRQMLRFWVLSSGSYLPRRAEQQQRQTKGQTLTRDRSVRRFPDLDFPQSDDPHVLRSQLLQMKAKMKEYASKAEAACYEVRPPLPSCEACVCVSALKLESCPASPAGVVTLTAATAQGQQCLSDL
jgi:hypothetical protein